MSAGPPEEHEPRRRRSEPTDAEVRREWAKITADLSDLKDLTGASGHDGPVPHESTPRLRDRPRSTPGAGSDGPRDYSPAEPEDEGFTPPELPKVGTTDPLPTLAWSAALGGPVALVLLLIFFTAAPLWLYLGVAAIALVGWGLLFWRMPRRRDDDDDNGAVL